ncbi:MAG: RNA polymerase sigma factor [candidate division Zixibacteria bacterium]|nr:RNA polymerase sigma factor [candidate division Zixibacteria bacterium]
MDKISDKELFAKVAGDDEQAFTQFVERYKNRLFNFIVRIISEKEAAEDILQDTFLRVYNQRKNYSPDYALSTWVYTIALNLVRSELRKRKLRKYLSLDFLKDESDIELPDNKNLEPGKLKPLLDKAVKALPEEYRTAFVLCDIDRLPYNEIAEIMRVPVGTVKSRINRARSMLREKLLPYKELNYELSKGLPQIICLY